MREFIYTEMMVHPALCTSKEPQNILIISDNTDALKQEVLRYNGIEVTTATCKLDEISSIGDKLFDVIISEVDADKIFLAQINRVLKDDGQLVGKHPSLDKVDENKALMAMLGNYFKIIMPYNLGDGRTALLCSKGNHPTADINLQRADMLDGLRYYNSDVHVAAFAMGNYIRKEYLGIVKN